MARKQGLNVLLVTADDMNWNSVGVYGGGPALCSSEHGGQQPGPE